MPVGRSATTETPGLTSPTVPFKVGSTEIHFFTTGEPQRRTQAFFDRKGR